MTSGLRQGSDQEWPHREGPNLEGIVTEPWEQEVPVELAPVRPARSCPGTGSSRTYGPGWNSPTTSPR